MKKKYIFEVKNLMLSNPLQFNFLNSHKQDVYSGVPRSVHAPFNLFYYIDNIRKHIMKVIEENWPNNRCIRLSAYAKSHFIDTEKKLYYNLKIKEKIIEFTTKDIQIQKALENYLEFLNNLSKNEDILKVGNKLLFTTISDDKSCKYGLKWFRKAYRIDDLFTYQYSTLLLNQDLKLFIPVQPLKYDEVVFLGIYGGYKQKDHNILFLNETFGKNNWRIEHIIDSCLCHKDIILTIYQKSYETFFNEYPQKLFWLLNIGSDIVAYSKTNLPSGINYRKQEKSSFHFEDIAIKNIIWNKRLKFLGNNVFNLKKGGNPFGGYFKPAFIECYCKDMLPVTDVHGFWKSNSVLDMYHKSLGIITTHKNLMFDLIGETKNYIFLKFSNKIFYLKKTCPKLLYCSKWKTIKNIRLKEKNTYKIYKDKKVTLQYFTI